MSEYQEGQLSRVGLSRHSPGGNQPVGPGYSVGEIRTLEQHRPTCQGFTLPLAKGEGNTCGNDDKGWQPKKWRNTYYSFFKLEQLE